MGGRHARGSRKGSWKKTEARVMAAAQQKLIETSRFEVEAAMLVAAQAETEAARLRCQVSSLSRSRDRLRAVCKRLCLRWAAAYHRPSRRAPGQLPAPTGLSQAASATAAVQTEGDAYSLLARQVDALQAENVLFNRLRFQCKNCTA